MSHAPAIVVQHEAGHALWWYSVRLESPQAVGFIEDRPNTPARRARPLPAVGSVHVPHGAWRGIHDRRRYLPRLLLFRRGIGSDGSKDVVPHAQEGAEDTCRNETGSVLECYINVPLPDGEREDNHEGDGREKEHYPAAKLMEHKNILVRGSVPDRR